MKVKKPQLARNNHYVPRWYQRGFFEKGQHKLHVLNLAPGVKTLPTGHQVPETVLELLGAREAFSEFDLYTTRFGKVLNDEIEKFFFGDIDAKGASAVRAWLDGGHVQVHSHFRPFFEYLDAQKLRTPKGLDWIARRYSELPQIDLMVEMQALRLMHAAMWSECVREIVSAQSSTVKFIVSDHPVTVYNAALPPGTAECVYPFDPGIELVGTQTIFPLDANHCLILTNLEYAEDPDGAQLLVRRTNARFRGNSLARTDALIRGRSLTEEEVHAINVVLKSRARKFIGASDPKWLQPEQHCKLTWAEIGKLLLPRDDLWRFGGETFIGYQDGSTAYSDKFGRTSRAHEALSKKPPAFELRPGDECGCGSGFSFGECCSELPLHKRPTWTSLSIRERNLILCRGIRKILGVDDDRTWLEIRKAFTDEQVKNINSLFASLWPADTQIADILPRPQKRRSRALYMGLVDARTVSLSITGVLPYFDELVIVNPFPNANILKPEFNPIKSPSKFREQTLRNAFILLLLEPEIAQGRVHLVPDPIDYDEGFRREIAALVTEADKVEIGASDKALLKLLHKDEMKRAIQRLPAAQMKAYFKQRLSSEKDATPDDVLDRVVEMWKQDLEEDAMADLQPLPAGGEFRIMKSFARDTGLFIATMTGSLVYCDSDTMWNRLHQSDGIRDYTTDSAYADAIDRIGAAISLRVPASRFRHETEPAGAAGIRDLIRQLQMAVQSGGEPPAVPDGSVVSQMVEDDLIPLGVRVSVPSQTFRRIEVSRLVVTFGRAEDVNPVHLGIYLERPKAGTTTEDENDWDDEEELPVM